MNAHEDWRQNPLVIGEICKHLDANDILSVRLVCHDWYHASKGMLYKKAIVKLVLHGEEPDTVILWDTKDEVAAPVHRFNRFIDWVDSMEEYEFQSLELAWCPLMKNHPVWSRVGPKVRNKLIVYKMHDVCPFCYNEEAYVPGLMETFSNVQDLSLLRGFQRYTLDSDADSDFLNLFGQNKPLIASSLPMPSCTNLKSFTVDVYLYKTSATFVGKMVPQLECLEVINKYNMYISDSQAEFFQYLENVLEGAQLPKTFKKVSLRCDSCPDGDPTLTPEDIQSTFKKWFSKFRAEKLEFYYCGNVDEIQNLLGCFPTATEKLEICLQIMMGSDSECVEISKNLYQRMVSVTTPFQLTVERHLPNLNVSLWKRCLPGSQIQSLVTSSNISTDALRAMVPNATYLCFCKADKVFAEVFGLPKLLHQDFSWLLDYLKWEEATCSLIGTAGFREHVGIPDDWFPKGSRQSEDAKPLFYLAYFAIEPKLIDEVRMNMPRFVYPASKLTRTFRLVETSPGEVGFDGTADSCKVISSTHPNFEAQ